MSYSPVLPGCPSSLARMSSDHLPAAPEIPLVGGRSSKPLSASPSDGRMYVWKIDPGVFYGVLQASAKGGHGDSPPVQLVAQRGCQHSMRRTHPKAHIAGAMPSLKSHGVAA